MNNDYENQKSRKIYFLIGLAIILIALFFILCYPFLK